jgi:superfamily II DNA or RNA helicase
MQGNVDWNDSLGQQSGDSQRNELICKLIRYFRARNIMVLVKRKEHANLLKKMLIAFGENQDGIEVYYGSAKEYNDKCRVLISTYSKSGVGMDCPHLNMLIVAADVEEQFIQYLGRVFRRDDEFPIMIDLVDKFRPMYNHSKSRCDTARDLGGNVENFTQFFPDVL